MKIQHSHRTRGFTLVELLVVIAIIAVLAAAGFTGVRFALEKAKKMKALAAATAVEGAINSFYTEYGVLPIADGEGASVGAEGTRQYDTNSDDGRELLGRLLGFEPAAGSSLNSRSIRFLNLQEGKANKDGLIYTTSGDAVDGLFDPWGGPYYVVVDDDYNDRITVDTAAEVAKTLNNRRVAVWSNGNDGVNGGGTAADDVKTW